MLHNEPLCVEGVLIVATEQIADRNETIEGPGKDRPLRDDIRLLGRILGDTLESFVLAKPPRRSPRPR